MRRPFLGLVLASCLLGGGLAASPAQSPAFFPIDEVRPGMVGIGRTVFSGDRIEEFKANVIGVLKNVIGPQRDLILARLEGGPLATTGVMQGMSGSPVYIDGRLVGAVSYALGSFPREPIAGITPIAEMMAAVSSTAPRNRAPDLELDWPAAPTAVYAALGRVASRSLAPLGRAPGDLRVTGPDSLADLSPMLRPIGAAMVVNGFERSVDLELREALAAGAAAQRPPARSSEAVEPRLRPGDPVGMSLIRGDLEMGATGTVTHVDGSRVYAFGHPFLNLGPTTFAMTRAHVYTVLPSLDSSMKIAGLGPVIGTVTQDRATAIGGTLGPGPRELEVNLTLTSERAPRRTLKFFVLQDQTLTPLFAYVAILNSLVAYERQSGALSVATEGRISFGTDGQVTVEDAFTGDSAITQAAAAATAAIGVAAGNEFKPAVAERMDMTLRISERQESATIERAWLDTTKPEPGATHTLQVMLRDYRGGTETIAVPVTMPIQASGPLTLLVSDAATLTGLEERELKPGRPSSWPALLNRLNASLRNNRVYVRLIASSAGTVVSGHTLPALPGSVRNVLDEDKTVSTAPVAKTVVGAWEHRMNRVVRGSRELSIALASRR